MTESPDVPDEELPPVGHRAPHARRVRRIGVVLWPSFLASVVATGIFFSQLDPDELRLISFPGLELSRMAGYTIGFFMFWAVTTLSSALTLFLLSRPQRRGARRQGRHEQQ